MLKGFLCNIKMTVIIIDVVDTKFRLQGAILIFSVTPVKTFSANSMAFSLNGMAKYVANLPF